MIYIEPKSDSIFYNLASEYYFATEKQFDEDVFMLWRVTPTLVIGKFQNTLEEIDAAYAKERGDTIAQMRISELYDALKEFKESKGEGEADGD